MLCSMSGYRDDKELASVDHFSLGYISARLGFGLLAISGFLLVIGAPIFLAPTAVVLGALLFLYGWRNP